jgi:hypothetical protein
MPHDVFISYSSKDKPMADAICATLEAKRIRCWIAPRDIMPGQDWSEAIIDGLSAARVFVLLLSESSNNSEQVKREVQNAVSDGLAIIPLRVEEVNLSKHMRYFIGTPHWLDAMTPPIESHLERLAQIADALLKATNDPDKVDDLLVEESERELRYEPAPRLQWDAGQLRRVETELASFVGPVARVLVQRAAAEAKDMASLCRETSRYIPEGSERERFLDATRALCEAAAAPVAVGAAAIAWDPEVLKTAERNLANFIGPLAKIHVKRASCKARNVDELYQMLVDNIEVAREKDAFLRSQPSGRN